MEVVQGKGLQAHLGLLPFPQGLEVKCSQVGPEGVSWPLVSWGV